jgi:predicted enzyme related to lactoylglutathione lyase
MNYHSASTWFEIPVANFERAVAFWEKTLGISMKVENMGHRMAVFPYQCPEGTGGCLIEGTCPPSSSGTSVYLLVKDSLEETMARAFKNGGQELFPITPLPDPIGRFAVIQDSEGNRVGLHQFPATS